MVIRGIVENGHVVPARPLGLPEGSPVFILSIAVPDSTRRNAAPKRVRERAIRKSLPDEAFSAEKLYDD